MTTSFATRRFVTREHNRDQVALALDHLAKNVPDGIEFVVRKETKKRTNDQNSKMWALISDIAKQVWIKSDRLEDILNDVDSKQYDADTWHYYFKTQFLPEEPIEGITKDGYKKWTFVFDQRVLCGSTTHLTTKGFADYIEQIYAFGSERGVMWGEREEFAA